jgi:hypothetical protein
MLAAQTQFRRVKGYQELPQLALTLERATAPSLECSTCHRLEVARRAEVADLARYTNRPGSG